MTTEQNVNLPEPSPAVGDGVYSTQDLIDAVLAERERCAKLIEQMCDYTGGQGGPATPRPSELAAAIRKGTP